MSSAGGRAYLAIPGPSVMPEEVLRAMHRAAPNIYEGELHELTHSLIPDLKYVARTDGFATIYIANGHGAWEAALANVAGPGDRLLMPATGRFGHGWAEMAEGLGAEVDLIDFGRSAPLDPNRVEDALRVDKDRRIKAVIAMIEEATGIQAFSVGKPSPVMMRVARKKLGLETAETTMIGDTMTTDILGGLQVGYRTILTLSGVSKTEDLKKFAFYPDLVVKNAGEVDLGAWLAE